MSGIRLAVIGVGLIGGSFARALRAAGKVDSVIGCGRNAQNLKHGVELGVLDEWTTDVAEAVRGADLVFVAVPLGAMRSVFEAMRDHLGEQAILTDAGSAKASVVADCEAAFGRLPTGFVPGHPIAGTEHSGVESSFADLYNNRRVILTPLESSSESALTQVKQFWQACGAQVSTMSVAHHDEVLAATSHLPHMLAFGLVDALANRPDGEEVFRYAAGGFRDFTRIASSNPAMWRDICVSNRVALSQMLSSFADEMQSLAAAIEEADGEQLFEIFQRAKTARDCYVDGIEEKP